MAFGRYYELPKNSWERWENNEIRTRGWVIFAKLICDPGVDAGRKVRDYSGSKDTSFKKAFEF